MKTCRDCEPGTKRPAPHPGPRCATHHRQVVRLRRQRTHERMVEQTYGLPPGAYEALYRAQGGRCAVCQRATGKTKRLAVDHDHRCCPGKTSCGVCVRALLCGVCNSVVLGRYTPEMLRRAIEILERPPPPLRGLEGANGL